MFLFKDFECFYSVLWCILVYYVSSVFGDLGGCLGVFSVFQWRS